MGIPAKHLVIDADAAEFEGVARGVLERHCQLQRVRQILESWHPNDVQRLQSVMEKKAPESAKLRAILRGGLPAEALFIYDTLAYLERGPELQAEAQAAYQLANAVLTLTADRTARPTCSAQGER